VSFVRTDDLSLPSETLQPCNPCAQDCFSVVMAAFPGADVVPAEELDLLQQQVVVERWNDIMMGRNS
jgi:hypothetical protein